MDVDSENIFPRTKVGRDHQMRDMNRHGKVIDRKHDKKRGPLVRVQYLDRQGLISAWLPVKQFGSRSTSHYYCPKIGDDINVTMPPSGNEVGFVDGSFFNASNPPPDGVDLDTRHYKTEDGSVIEYREKDSTFNLNVGGAVAKTGPRAGASSGGAVVVNAGEVEITAPVIKINGDIQHQGNITTSGNHTDAAGVHMGGTTTSELEERVKALEERMTYLEAKTSRWH